MHTSNQDLVGNQLYLYTRQLYPGTPFDDKVLDQVLDEYGIDSLKQLYRLDEGGRARLAARVIRLLEDQVAYGDASHARWVQQNSIWQENPPRCLLPLSLR